MDMLDEFKPLETDLKQVSTPITIPVPNLTDLQFLEEEYCYFPPRPATPNPLEELLAALPRPTTPISRELLQTPSPEPLSLDDDGEKPILIKFGPIRYPSDFVDPPTEPESPASSSIGSVTENSENSDTSPEIRDIFTNCGTFSLSPERPSTPLPKTVPEPKPLLDLEVTPTPFLVDRLARRSLRRRRTRKSKKKRSGGKPYLTPPAVPVPSSQ